MLCAIDEGEARREWTAFDLRYGEIKVEVKATGLSQTRNCYERSRQPSFDIAPRKRAWDAETDEWMDFDPPARPTQLYVFYVHEPVPATNENVRDPACWRFWVIPTQTLNEKFGRRRPWG